MYSDFMYDPVVVSDELNQTNLKLIVLKKVGKTPSTNQSKVCETQQNGPDRVLKIA